MFFYDFLVIIRRNVTGFIFLFLFPPIILRSLASTSEYNTVMYSDE